MWDKRPDMIVHESEPYNAEPPRRGLVNTVTPLDTFYVRNHGPVPHINANDWTLAVDGLVNRPLQLSLDDLKELWQHRTFSATMQCAGNRRAGLLDIRDIPGEDPWGPGATSNAMWTGVSLADVLATAGVDREARHVAFAAPDVSDLAEPPQAYGASINVRKAMSEEVLLAWAMNDEPLPAVHGGPLRLVVPGYIGARSVKWLQRITVQYEPSDNYFQATAYRLLPAEADPAAAGPGDGLSLASVALNADILSPDDGAAVSAGLIEVTGYAHCGDDRTVARVDVSTDDGQTWAQAELDPPLSPWSWRIWRITVLIRPGEPTLTVRAWDDTGASQPESARHLWNPKGYINNSWARVALRAV